ncbi:hypothetical protein Tco_0032785 [Tanacetum coccineum]
MLKSSSKSRFSEDFRICQLDEQWFDLTKDTLRDAFQITPVDTNNAFSSPPTPDALIKFVNYLVQFHPRLGSLLHLPNEEHVLGYLKFSAKGTKREVFRMPIPNDLITDDIRGVPENEPRIGDEEADLQKVVEESLKEVHSARQGPLPPVVIREPEFGKFQPLPEVQGKGKEKVNDEQVTLDLLTLQTPKKKSPTDSDEEVSGMVARVQAEGQAGPNPGEHDEGQAGPNPGDVAASQPPSSHVVHAGPNLEHMDLEAFDTSIQPNPEQIDEEFTTTTYPNVHENLKLPTKGEVRLEEPASSARTLSSLQHLDKELSFAD